MEKYIYTCLLISLLIVSHGIIRALLILYVCTSYRFVSNTRKIPFYRHVLRHVFSIHTYIHLHMCLLIEQNADARRRFEYLLLLLARCNAFELTRAKSNAEKLNVRFMEHGTLTRNFGELVAIELSFY